MKTQVHQKINHDKSDPPRKKYIDVHSQSSDLSGLAGFIETLLRRFRTGFFLSALSVLYAIVILAMGLSAAPAIYFFTYILKITLLWHPLFHFIALGIALICGYFIYGFVLIFLIPFFNFIMPFKVKPFRGGYYSLKSIPWYFHNAFIYVVRYTFLEFITPTPLNILFYKMMGMKIGKGVHINTTNISDAALIELDDYVTIGGSAHIFAHYAAKGYLVLSTVKIGKGATVGLKATIMGDVEIGKNANVAPQELILPKSRIPDNRKPPGIGNKEDKNSK
ncbi:MAG: hypothetical protein P8X42_12460 [Calditrichaceae bacterium]|jgi:hypothetical protein